MNFLHFAMRPVHVSWHIATFCTGLIIGVALVAGVEVKWFIDFYWPLLAIAAVILVTVKRYVFMLLLALVAGCCVGLWRGTNEQMQLSEVSAYYGQQVAVRGTVTEDTTFGPNGDQRVRLRSVSVDSVNIKGHMWVSTSSQADIKRGDIVIFNGRLNDGFGNMVGTMFRASLTEAQRPRPGDVAREVRDWFGGGVYLAVPNPEASLGMGYLAGQRSTLPQDLEEHLRILGLTHVVVASGYNLTILVRFARRIFARISKYMAAAAASGMMIGFVLVTGFSPSMTRAALVTGLSLLAWYYGRTIHPFVLLPFVAAITIAIEPTSLWGDVGWYLSFLSFVGVIILAPLVQQYFWNRKKRPGVIRQITVDTMAAQLATLPIIAFVFAQYSPLALPANLLILPLVPLAMVLTFVAGIVGVLMPVIAEWAGLPAYAVLRYMTFVTDWLASLPWAYGELPFNKEALIISYVVFISIILFLWHKTKYNFANSNVVD